LKSLQGADERLKKTQEQLHQLQAQNIEQAHDLKYLRSTAMQAQQLEAAHHNARVERQQLDDALHDTRAENVQLAEEVHSLQRQVHGLLTERALVFAEIDKMFATCNELASMVT
jgi:uncharacterized coiled-coil DUF342 family protein